MSQADRVAVWIATVFGLGRSPWAPGTVGSAVGVGLGLAAVPWPTPIRWALVLIGFAAAVFISSAAERTLGQTDPPAVILDEVWAMAALLMILPWTASSWPWTVTAFVLFRFFDVTKPPPVRRLGDLPAGWGIVIDDLGAAVYSAAVLWLLRMLLTWLSASR